MKVSLIEERDQWMNDTPKTCSQHNLAEDPVKELDWEELEDSESLDILFKHPQKAETE